MPEISRFYGIIIAMFYSEHNPPHFHVRYGSDKALIEIRNLRVLEGWLPPRALGLVVEWASQHQNELMQNWELARAEQQPKKIEPLR
jgi:hypothetical protein